MTNKRALSVISPAALAAGPEPALPPDAMAELLAARAELERESLTARLAAILGRPIEGFKRQLPAAAQRTLDAVLRRSLTLALVAALRREPARTRSKSRSDWLQRGLTVGSGLAGGAFGLPGTLMELPVSTMLLLRQIAAEAVAAGEDATSPATAVECLKIFALGAPGPEDDATETGYFATRLALARFLPNLGAAALPGFIGAVAARFTGPVLLKVSAQAAPLLGAAAGATVNLAFLEHYRRLARAHFTILRLERAHGTAAVRRAFEDAAAVAPRAASHGSAPE
jgi:hypothetical protein